MKLPVDATGALERIPLHSKPDQSGLPVQTWLPWNATVARAICELRKKKTSVPSENDFEDLPGSKLEVKENHHKKTLEEFNIVPNKLKSLQAESSGHWLLLGDPPL